MTVLGTPLGHPAYVRSRLAAVSEKHDQLIAQILSVSDLQCAWILLLYCAAARPNYLLRVVHPGLTARFAAHYDASLRRALSQLVSAPPTHMFWDVVSLPFSRGGLGLRSAVLTTWMAGDWKSSLTDSLCGEAPNLQLMVSHQGGWDRQAPCSTPGWRCSGRSTENKGAQVSRAGRQRGTCTARGGRSRSGGTVLC